MVDCVSISGGRPDSSGVGFRFVLGIDRQDDGLVLNRSKSMCFIDSIA